MKTPVAAEKAEVDGCMNEQINAWTGFVGGLGTLFGVLGALLVSWMKGKGSLEATIDARFQALLDRQNAELEAKIAELKEKREEVARLEHEGRTCEQRCSDLERELERLRQEIAELRILVGEVSDAQSV